MMWSHMNLASISFFHQVAKGSRSSQLQILGNQPIDCSPHTTCRYTSHKYSHTHMHAHQHTLHTERLTTPPGTRLRQLHAEWLPTLTVYVLYSQNTTSTTGRKSPLFLVSVHFATICFPNTGATNQTNSFLLCQTVWYSCRLEIILCLQNMLWWWFFILLQGNFILTTTHGNNNKACP